MKNKNIFLFFPFIIFLGCFLYYSYFLQSAQEVFLPIKGYDPRNLLSGHYIQFQIDWEKANCQQANWSGVCPLEDFVDTNRYYIPEDNARELESIINNSGIDTQISVAYKKGAKPIVKDLFINGENWKKYIIYKK